MQEFLHGAWEEDEVCSGGELVTQKARKAQILCTK